MKQKIKLSYEKSLMSTKTKDFLQKICFKKAASVDMTKKGFVIDSKVHPINLLFKPLKEKLEKIWGNYEINSLANENLNAKSVNGKTKKVLEDKTRPTSHRICKKKTTKAARKDLKKKKKKQSNSG